MLLYYDFQEVGIDEEENTLFEIEPNLFSIGTNILPSIQLLDDSSDYMPRFSQPVMGNIEVDTTLAHEDL